MGEDRPLANVTDYMIRSIEEHQDYPAILVVMCLLSLFSVAGTVGNAFVIYVFSKQRDKPTSTMFIITLAATDFFTCLCIVPHTIVWEYLSKRMQYDVICKIYNFLITSNVPFSFFIMVAIAFDRYFKICRPWTHAMDPPVAKRVIVGLLIFALSLGIIPSFSYGIYERKDSVNTTPDVVDVSEHSSVSGDVSMTTTPLVNYSSYDSINRDKLSNTTGKPPAYYYGMCVVSERFFSIEVRMFYQKIYASLFLIAFILVAILYGLIFKSLMTRRAKKLQNSMSNGNTCKSQVNQTSTASQTCISSSRFVTNEEQKGADDTSNESLMPRRPLQSNKDREREKIKNVREKQRIANIKTAGILFIVTAVFIAAFLPSWLMAVRMIPANMILFYMYFSYNVANPIIYAFFNRSFRAEMKNVIHCKKATAY